MFSSGITKIILGSGSHDLYDDGDGWRDLWKNVFKLEINH